MLAPDEVRLRHARRLLRGMPFICFAAQERDAVRASSKERIWRAPSGAALLSLREALSYVGPEGPWAVERAPERSLAPRPLTGARVTGDPDWLLPARLKPAEKRTLDFVGDWPWIRADHLASLLGVARRRVAQLTADLVRLDVITAHRSSGHRRFVLTDRGLALLAHRDRASVGMARKRWSAALLDPEEPLEWRNLRGRRTRQLLRNLTHTEAVHRFLAALADQACSKGWRVTQLEPPQRASRYFRYEDRLHSIQPDAFGVLSRYGRDQPFFLEWERRAIRPSTMALRLAPYLRYYSSKRPLEDHGAPPFVLVVFEDELAADHFRRVAQEQTDRAGVDMPLLISHRSLLVRHGLLGISWWSPGRREPQSLNSNSNS